MVFCVLLLVFFAALGVLSFYILCFSGYLGALGLLSLLPLHSLVLSSVIFGVPWCVLLLALVFIGAVSWYTVCSY